MILFFVLISRDDFKTAAITEVHSAELFLYSMAMMAVIIGMIQVVGTQTLLQNELSHLFVVH